jgi:hypothetical protein
MAKVYSKLIGTAIEEAEEIQELAEELGVDLDEAIEIYENM